MLDKGWDSPVTKFVLEAYLPASVSKVQYRPDNVRFWTAVITNAIGNLSFASGLLFVFHLNPLVSCVLSFIGLGLIWIASHWLDPRIARKNSSSSHWFISTIGGIPTMAVLMVMCRFNPNMDFGLWYVNPFLFPVVWMLSSSSYFQISTAIRETRLARNTSLPEAECVEKSFDSVGFMLRKQPPVHQQP